MFEPKQKFEESYVQLEESTSKFGGYEKSIQNFSRKIGK
jgi:hypothetical protein